MPGAGSPVSVVTVIVEPPSSKSNPELLKSAKVATMFVASPLT